MTIVSCLECKKDITNEATACPHCGYPVSENATTQTRSTVSDANNDVTKWSAADTEAYKKNGFAYYCLGFGQRWNEERQLY